MIATTTVTAQASNDRFWDRRPLPDDSIVKLASVSQAANQTFRGSGILFSHQGKSYVLTSEHVLLHGNQDRGNPILHKVWNPKIGSRRAVYLASDWSKGLALLSVPDLDPTPWLDLRNFVADTVGVSDRITVAGYPADSQALAWNDRARYTSGYRIKSPVYGFPLLWTFRDSKIEYGMSGGAALDERKIPIGLLSHQYIAVVAPGEDPNMALAIPIDAAAAWVRDYLEAPHAFVPRFFIRIEDQLNGGLSWPEAGKLRFETFCSGGQCAIYLIHRPNGASIPLEPGEEWMVRAVEYYARVGGRQPLFAYGVRLGGPSRISFRRGFSNVAEFLAYAAEPGGRVICSSDLGRKADSLLPAARLLNQSIEAASQPSLDPSHPANALLESLQLIDVYLARLRENPNGWSDRDWDHLYAGDFDHLLASPDHTAAWAALETDRPAQARSLRDALTELRKLYSQLVIDLPNARTE